MATSKDDFCQLCKEDNNQGQKVIGFCVQCIEYLCDNCVRGHKRNKASANHKLLCGEDIPSDPDIFHEIRHATTCSVHDKKLSYYCCKHNEYICKKCITPNQKHRHCEDLDDLENPSLSAEDTAIDLKGLKHSISIEQNALLTVIGKEEENLQQLDVDHRTLQCECDKLCDKLTEKIKKGKKKLLKTSNVITQEKADMINKTLSECKTVQETLDMKLRLLQGAEQYMDSRSVKIIAANVSNELSSIKPAIENKKRFFDFRLKFSPNRDLFGFIYEIGNTEIVEELRTLEMERNASTNEDLAASSLTIDSEELDSDGIVNWDEKTGETADEDADELRDRVDNNVNAETELVSNREMRVEPENGKWILYKTKTVKLDVDQEECSIVKILLTSTNEFILLDRTNKALKLFDEAWKLKGYKALSGTPVDVCMLGTCNCVAVAYEKSVEYLKFEDFSSFARKLVTFRIIAVVNISEKKIALLTECKEKSIDIRNVKSWQTLDSCKSIKFCNEHNEMSLSLQSMLSGTYTSFGNNLYIGTEDTMLCVNHKTFTCHWYCKSSRKNRLKNITCVTTGRDGTVFMCCRELGNIQACNARDFKSRRVIINGLTRPMSICLDSNEKYMYVGSLGADEIQIYRYK